jgi:outer membrane biosynthesis protein TonB
MAHAGHETATTIARRESEALFGAAVRPLSATIEGGAIEMKARSLLLAAVFAAAPAFAQQNVDISGADFQSGAGDARLTTLGREAAKSGRRVVVTAPQEWHAKIAAKIRAGGAADVVLKDGFYENVLVRVEDKPEPPKPEPKAEAKAEPKPEPKAARTVANDRVPVDVPGPKPTLPPPAPEPKPVVTAPPPPVATPAPVVAAPPPAAAKAAPVATATPAAAPAAATPDVVKIQKRLEESLNNGRAAEGPLSVAGLQNGDTIFVDGPVRAVVRRESLRPRMFWLDGDLDLRRTELKDLGGNRYQVLEPVRGESYSLREDHADQGKSLVAAAPPANSPGRATFERDYNDGHAIDETIAVDKLRSGDLVYAGKGMAVVVRREGAKLARFWLVGTLDLGQTGLSKDGNKYKVISDTLR